MEKCHSKIEEKVAKRSIKIVCKEFEKNLFLLLSLRNIELKKGKIERSDGRILLCDELNEESDGCMEVKNSSRTEIYLPYNDIEKYLLRDKEQQMVTKQNCGF